MKYNDFYWANDASLQFMYPDYLDQNETPQSRVRDIANNAESILGINGFADKFYNYMAKGYYSLSTPVWKNFGKKNGSPISCFGIDIQDDTSDILKGVAEIGMMTKQGGGTAGYFGKLRPRGANISGGSKSNGSVSFMPLFQEVTNTISQTNRRGFFAAYHDIDHDDFDEFMKARTEGDTLQTIALALCVSDDFMKRVENGDKEAQRRWVKVIKKRDESGFPYLYFTDTANKNKPQVYKDKNMMLRHSQMCNEIYEYTDEHVSFVCALSSINLLHWDEIKNTDAIETLTYFMDAVYTEFIQKAEGVPFMDKALRFAKDHRSIGIGVLGWHSYLQSKMIAFESMEANFKTTEIFKEIDKRTLIASKELADKFGEPTILNGYGERFSTRCVSGDTKVLTKDGHFEIKSLVGKDVDIWNGYEFSKVKPYETGVSELYRVTLNNGKHIDCTSDHVFKVLGVQIDRSNINNKRIIDVKTKDLRVGDVLSKFRLPVIDGELELKDGYTQGFYSGDGSISNTRNGKYPRKEIRLYGKKMECVDRIVWKSVRKCNYNGVELIRGYIDNSYEDKYFVPINNYSLKSKLEWLSGIIDSDGCSQSKGISITSKYKSFVEDISYMLQTLGCHSYISEITRTGGYSKERYEKSIYYGINISFQACTILHNLGLKTERVKVPVGIKGYDDTPMYSWVEVVDIEDLNREEMTYCFTEPKNNTGVFNGVMTGQCAVAPTTSSSFILGQVSPSIEPLLSNCFLKDLSKGKFFWKNPFLEELLEKKGINNDDVWDKIMKKDGSVQYLDELDENEKEIFKTFAEISQKEIIIQASIRQKFIDQGQSLNLMLHPETTMKENNSLLFEAWRLGLKGLYYQRSANVAQKVSRDITNCSSCES